MTTSHPLHVQVNNPTEIFQIFDSITYDKVENVNQTRSLNIDT